MAVYAGGLMFSPGRIALSVLFLPALGQFFTGLSRGRRSILGADLFVLALSAWMLGAPYFEMSATSSPLGGASEVLEFFGAFLIGRAYVYGRPALESFMQALAAVAVVLTAIAVTDVIFGQYIVYDTTARLFGARYFGAIERSGIVRAQSTFDHPILFGAFGTVCAAIFLHCETGWRRLLYFSVCLFGAILSISSGPLLAFGFMVGAFLYGTVMSNFPWRWKVFWAAIGLFLCALFSVSNSPVGWIIDHLTFDPVGGYFRLASWYSAFDRIAQSPWTGFFREKSGDEFLDRTVDSVWLVIALLYGLPAVAFLILANLASFWRTRPERRPLTEGDVFMNWMRAGFTSALAMFMLIGLTVHYWNAMWMFWGLCIGIRTSLQEQYFASSKKLPRPIRLLQTSPDLTPSS